MDHGMPPLSHGVVVLPSWFRHRNASTQFLREAALFGAGHKTALSFARPLWLALPQLVAVLSDLAARSFQLTISIGVIAVGGNMK